MRRNTYRIVVKESVLRDIRRLPQLVVQRLYEHIAALANEPIPSGAEKIHGYNHYYRIRVGAYRVIYEVGRSIRIITIIRIGHRKDVYKRSW